jgi:geranylgeranyl diphosphate synthase type II
MGIGPSSGKALVSGMDIETYLEEKAGHVNECLDGYFSREDPDVPGVLREAMRYSLLAGGKRLRPILCIAAHETCGGKMEDVLLCASALEVIHTYSLIHDDLPAMDNDDLRRGRPTNHKVYGEAMAILAGDGLLSEAFMMMIETGEGISRSSVLEAVREVARASGPGGMVGGQVVDILSEDKEPDRDTLLYIHMHKTGALMASSVRLGGILADADEESIKALTGYGEALGLAFQIVDDILDVRGDEALLGKPVGSDEEKHKMTYPSLYGLDASMAKAEELMNEAVGALEPLSERGASTDALRGIAEYILRRTH